MDQHVDLGFRQVEQAGCLDQLQPFVEHSRRIDADLTAHRPDRDGARQPPAWPPASRRGLAVRNGPPDAVRTIRSTARSFFSAMAWKIALCSESTGNRIAPASAHGLQHDIACADQSLLIGERNRASPPDRCQGGGQAGSARDRRHGPIDPGSTRPPSPQRRPRATSDRVAGQTPPSSVAYWAGSLITASSAPRAIACCAKTATLRPPVRQRT